MCGSTINSHFLTQKCKPWNISTVILREEGLNSLTGFVQNSFLKAHFLDGIKPWQQGKGHTEWRVHFMLPWKKLNPAGVGICSEAMSSWECLPLFQTSWMFSGFTHLSAGCGGNLDIAYGSEYLSPCTLQCSFPFHMFFFLLDSSPGYPTRVFLLSSLLQWLLYKFSFTDFCLVPFYLK